MAGKLTKQSVFDSIGHDLKTLRESRQVKFDHHRCAAGVDTKKRLYVEIKGKLLLAYCHHCGKGGAFPVTWDTKGVELESDYRVLRSGGVGPICTPTLISEAIKSTGGVSPLYTLAHPGLIYLSKYLIKDHVIDAVHSGYVQVGVMTPNVPYVEYLGTVANGVYQRRFFDDRGMATRWFNTYKPPNVEACLWWKPGNDTVVVVEDPVSALKVLYATEDKVDVVALLGTKVGDDTFLELMEYKKVILAFDNDKAGHAGADALEQRLLLYGHTNVERRVWTTEISPKEVRYVTIKDWILK